MLIEKSIACPYCGENVDLLIDPSLEKQRYVEDCSVCCRPMEIAVRVSGSGLTEVSAGRDDD